MKFHCNHTLKRGAKAHKCIAIIIAMLMMPLLCLQLMGNTARSEQPPETGELATDLQEVPVPDETGELATDGQKAPVPVETGESVSDAQETPIPAETDESTTDAQEAPTPAETGKSTTDTQEVPIPAETDESATGEQEAPIPAETDESTTDIQDVPVPAETDDSTTDAQEAPIPAETDDSTTDEQDASEDTLTAYSGLESLESAQSAEGYAYAATIDLSAISDASKWIGYTISGDQGYAYNPNYLVTKPVNNLIFNSAANNKAYHIIQTGVPNAGVGSPNGVKYGTSMIMSISVPDGVAVTLVINDIHLIGNIELEGTAKVSLLLEGKNYIRSSILVPIASEITIDSLNKSSDDCLIMPSEAGTRNENAKIGGWGGGGSTAGYSAGKITINGGVINITARSTGACIGGGGRTTSSVNGTAGNAEMIMINGGTISVTQYGSGNDFGIGFSGAGIGGGGGDGNMVFGGAGNVIITGGMVTVRQYTRAAGIGGGTFGPAGNVTIKGGNVDVEVIRLINESGSGEGAGIGTAAGINAGTGNITISGGTVRSVAYMTGIGRVHGSDGVCNLSINITGGTVYAKGTSGPGIGSWSSPLGNTITITGGTVIAESDLCTGIGGRTDGATLFRLDAAANVRAYSGGTKPAINTADNTGNGYFVNAGFKTQLSGTAPTTLDVYSESNGVLLKTLTLPATYRNFAYSSDLTVSRTDNILAYKNPSAFIGTVIRDCDSSPQIYSIKLRDSYNVHNYNAKDGVLPVKLQTVGHFTVTEKYVDIYGSPIEGVANSTSIISPGNAYSKEIPAISGYIGKGHKWDTAPDGSGLDYVPGLLADMAITKNRTVYFVYAQVPAVTDLTISKTVTGKFADKTRSFEFTAYFENSNHDPLPVGTILTYEITDAKIATPSSGFLMLDSDGKATFQLSHGQSITIADVPLTGFVHIIETLDPNYDVSFIDSDSTNSDPIEGNDTGELAMTENRVIDITNARSYVPLTGLKTGNNGALLLFPIIALLAGQAYIAIKASRRIKE